MAIEMTTFEQDLLLSWWPADRDASYQPLLHQVIKLADYAGILRRCSRYFHYSAATGLLVRFDSSAVTDLERLVCGIAALQAFVQTNWTGPDIDLDPCELFGDALDSKLVNARAVEALSMHGEPAYHLAKKSGFLWLAREIFAPEQWLTQDASSTSILKSVPVWAFRCALVNLRLLDSPVPLEDSLIDGVQTYISTIPTTSQRDLKTSLILLVGLYHAHFVQFASSATKASNEQFYDAAKTAQLQYELTGRLGKRTRWQIDEKSQLVVLARSRQRDDGWQPREVMSLQQHDQQSANDGSADRPKELLLNDDTLLERTHFTSSTVEADGNDDSSQYSLTSIDPNKQPVLHPLDQSVMLALSLSITNTSPNHGLTTEQIAAFVSRVLSDGSQNWSIYSMALLLRSRLEANRSRTVERGLLQMQSLVDQLKLESVSKPKEDYDLNLEKGASPHERLQYFFNINLPSTWELERELATRYLGLGVTRSAMEIFTRLEMWEDVARCYSSLGEEEKAVKVVKDLLDGRILQSESTMALKKGITLSAAQKAKLWCLLGDLEHNPEHYETAWTLSKESSSRAMRSLGQTYVKQGEWHKAQECLEKALRINPLYGKVWFVLGCAAMRNEDWQAAERAFRRCTALDDEDGESWNNLATVVLKQCVSATAEKQLSDEEREFSHQKKRSAFTCLGQAIKHSYDSWRVWTNYLIISTEIGELMEACRAMTRLIELRGEKDGEAAIDLEILDRFVVIAGRDKSETVSNGHGDSLVRGLSGRVKALFEECILPRITNSSHVYQTYARFLLDQHRTADALQAYLKAYRVDVVTNEGITSTNSAFETAAVRVKETVAVLRDFGPQVYADEKEWRLQIKSILRSFLGRTKNAFSETETWEALNEDLKSLKSA